jgi:hypothetical protein
MSHRAAQLLFLAALPACADSTVAPLPAPPRPADAPRSVQLPGGEGGVGLDDLRWSPMLQRALVPGGRTGNLDLVDPQTGAVSSVPGFGSKDAYSGGHGDGCTSADEGAGVLFAIDRTRRMLAVVDPEQRTILSETPLAAGPDYVRYVPMTHEVWVTEPSAEVIEIFSLSAATPPVPTLAGQVSVPGGPESLVIDGTRGRAYTHLWRDTTLAIDLAHREVVARWPNACKGSRGIALDEPHGLLFVGCEEGRAATLDVAHDGKLVGSAPTGRGVDIIACDAARGRLYVPAEDGTLTILGFTPHGALSVVGTRPVPDGAQGVTTDGAGHVFVGDPEAGRLIILVDDQPAGP